MGEIETKAPDVPYIVHEATVARLDNSYKEQIEKLHKAHKRVTQWLFIIVLGLIILLVGSNAGWLYYESQYMDEVTVTQEATADGNNNIDLQNIGENYYGSES